MLVHHFQRTIVLLTIGVLALIQYVPALPPTDAVAYEIFPGAPVDLPRTLWNEIFEMRERYQRVFGEVPKYYATPLIYDAIKSGEYDPAVAYTTPTTQGYTLRYSGTHCNIYVDTRVSVSDSTINSLGSLFDNKIFPTDTSWFNKKGDVSFAYIYIYPMDGGGGVGGYFNPYTPNNLYVDSYDLSWADEIMAHEFQHLIHHREDPNESTWLNEGCSDLAAYINFGLSASGLRSHLYYFYRFPNNDLLDFQDGVYGVDDYGAAASFMIYLMEKYGGKNFIRDLVHNTRNSASSITTTLSAHGYSKDFWGVFNDWKVALLLDSTSYGEGEYGFTSYNMKVSDSTVSATFSFYPINYSTEEDLKSYAPYYYKMTDGVDNLRFSFRGENSQFNVRLVMMSSSTVVSVKTLPISGGSGEIPLQGFGREYDRIYFIPSTKSSGGFSVSVDISDLVPPVTNLSVSPPEPDGNNGWYVTSPLVSLETEEGATTYFRIDNGETTPYTKPFYMPEGVHTLYYHSVDEHGNAEDVKSKVFRVDSTPPYSSASVSPPEPDGENGWYITHPSVNFSGEDGALILYKMDNGVPQVAPGEIDVPDGIHHLTYWAVDQAGNVEENHTLFIKVDTHPPQIDYSVSPEYPDGNHMIYVTQPTVTLHAQEEAATYYRVDGGPVKYYTAPFTVHDGEHVVEAWGEDLAGNVGSSVSFTVKVDTTPPTVRANFTVKSHGGWFNRTPGILLVASEEGDIYYQVDGGEVRKYYGEFTVGRGVHHVTFWAVDVAGNRGPQSNITVKVDKTPDEVNLKVLGEMGRNEWYVDAAEVQLSTEKGVARIFYRLDDGPWKEYRKPFRPPEGEHRIYYYSIDQAGNIYRIKWEDIRIDLTDPMASINFSSNMVEVGETVYIIASGSHDNVGVYLYRFDFGDGNSTGWSITPVYQHTYSIPGKYIVRVEVMDYSGRISASAHGVISVFEPPSPITEKRIVENPLVVGSLTLALGITVIILLTVIYMKRST